MKTKSFFITTLLCIFTLLFATSFSFAGNIGRAVYSIYTENFNGVHFDAPSSDVDSVQFQLWGDQSMGSETMTDTPVEGKSYFKLTNGTPHPESWIWKYGGGGYVSTNSNGYHNMSAYNGGNIKFYVRSSDSNMENMKVGVQLQDKTDIIVSLASLGFTANGQWQELSFPLTNANGITSERLANIKVLFIFNLPEANYVIGESICFDNIRWVKTGEGSFTVTVRNISDNQILTGEYEKITWTQADFRQSWTAAQQYIELDLDKESSNWYVRIYLNNGKASRTGLYCVDSDGSEIVLPMAWRIRPDLLPNNDGDTLLIGRTNYEGYGLYDKGKYPEGSTLYTWSFMRELKAGIDNDDVRVWNLSGIHTVVWNYSKYESLADYYERNPKIYFAADCSNAIGGLEYEANVVTELVYE